MTTKKAVLILKTLTVGVCCAVSMAFLSCSKDDSSKDMTPPAISTQGITASPVNCQVYHPGDVIYFRYLFEDNQELGSFNIEVHSNFDHHSHSTESDEHGHEDGECSHEDHDHEADGEAEEGTPWVFNQSYQIPAGTKSYSAAESIAIPADAMHGDYHFMIRVTDAAGWQQLKAVAIIVE